MLAAFQKDKETNSQARPEGRDTEAGAQTRAPHTAPGPGTRRRLGASVRPPQSTSASESAYLSSHLTSKGLSRPGRSSSRCESSLSVGALLAVVSCSVS